MRISKKEMFDSFQEEAITNSCIIMTAGKISNFPSEF